ncbi:MAG: LAGLIDADG endonuclease [bacterium]|nr:LAGLIDADG endonuclease [bacterium]
MDDIVGRLQSKFSSHQVDVIVGSLLGDARLECRSVGKRSPITARFRVHHGEKQKEYVFWKYEILKDFVSIAPREISWINPKRNLHEISWYFHTKSLEELGILYHFFYKSGTKILPEEIFSFLTPRMIAVWFMDDGSNNGESLTLNTHGFSKEDQMCIVDFFKELFDISPTIVKDRTKWKIAIGRKDFRKFISLIEPYIIPAMSYKIANPRNDLSRKAGQSEKPILANTSVPKLENLEKV